MKGEHISLCLGQHAKSAGIVPRSSKAETEKDTVKLWGRGCQGSRAQRSSFSIYMFCKLFSLNLVPFPHVDRLHFSVVLPHFETLRQFFKTTSGKLPLNITDFICVSLETIAHPVFNRGIITRGMMILVGCTTLNTLDEIFQILFILLTSLETQRET